MIAYSKLPRTGIGNKLFVWAQGYVFSKTNNCRHITTGWTKLHIGPILRGDASWRFYRGYTKTSKLFFDSFVLFTIFPFKKKKFLKQEDCDKTQIQESIYCFDTYPLPKDYFFALNPQREALKIGLQNYLNPSITEQAKTYTAPFIGVHIRLGDYKKSGLLSPMSYYTEGVKKVRQIIGEDVPVTVFTDGSKEEVNDILMLPNTHLANDDKDIVHLLWLSRSQIIIMSSISTFSLWAGFLADDSSILMYDKSVVKNRIRLEPNLYEGGIEDIKQGLLDLKYQA
jgi:hypothetical protein